MIQFDAVQYKRGLLALHTDPTLEEIRRHVGLGRA